MIFLQSVAYYLDGKYQEKDFDESFAYSISAFIHYLEWVVEHETPFLSDLDKLEYPNHTWVAQDLRKANLLYIASIFDPSNQEKYLKKGRYFEEYVCSKLGEEETNYFSRILIILMQNDFEPSLYKIPKDERDLYSSRFIEDCPPPMRSISNIMFSIIKDLTYRLFNFSYSIEKKWISFRI